MFMCPLNPNPITDPNLTLT